MYLMWKLKNSIKRGFTSVGRMLTWSYYSQLMEEGQLQLWLLKQKWIIRRDLKILKIQEPILVSHRPSIHPGRLSGKVVFLNVGQDEQGVYLYRRQHLYL